MNAYSWPVMRYIRIPAALPMIASGIKVAVVVAPIGAVIGEWSGASEGLGYFMMYNNSLLNVAGMFAALTILSIETIVLYFSTNWLMQKILFWVDHSSL